MKSIMVQTKRGSGYWGHCLLLVMLSVCLRDSFEVKAVEVEHPRINDTQSNEVLLLNDSNSKEETTIGNFLDMKTSHPHSINDKPTKFDLDETKLVWTESTGQSFKLKTSDDKKKFFCKNGALMKCLEKTLGHFLDQISMKNSINITEAVRIVQNKNFTVPLTKDESIFDKIKRIAKNYAMQIDLNKNLLTSPQDSRTFFGAVYDGKNPFLTGFGLGFLAFGLKKLLLPLVLGAQIIKGILLILFLPSIIGSLGKIVGKGLTSFAQTSQGVTTQPEENFEFKDNSDAYNDDYLSKQPLGTLPASAMYDDTMMMQPSPKPDSRFSYVDSRLSPAATFSDRYYMRHMANYGMKKQDFKVFHDIPKSSLLLTNYDPFYSPLLSRVDAVFARLGHTEEGCREYIVCALYKNPARYAPYSNLISAQLSKELNELRRPASDNPDILRYFRYMKAAKDGQDGEQCEEVYHNCSSARDDPSLRQNQAMLATYQDIDKLVHARKL